MKTIFSSFLFLGLLACISCTSLNKANELLNDEEYFDSHCFSLSTKSFSHPSVEKEYIFNECNVNNHTVLFFSIPESNKMLEKKIYNVGLDDLYLVKSRCRLGKLTKENTTKKDSTIYESCYVFMTYDNIFGIRQEIEIASPPVKVTDQEAIEDHKRKLGLY